MRLQPPRTACWAGARAPSSEVHPRRGLNVLTASPLQRMHAMYFSAGSGEGSEPSSRVHVADRSPDNAPSNPLSMGSAPAMAYALILQSSTSETRSKGARSCRMTGEKFPVLLA